LRLGQHGKFNSLLISSGGQVNDVDGAMGVDADGGYNQATVSGANSLWNNSSQLHVGENSGHNTLLLTNGGTAAALNNVVIGSAATSTNNRVTVDGGTLRVTNASNNASFIIQRGTNVLNAGLIEADQLQMTLASGFCEFNGGTLAARTANVNNGVLFTVGNGSSAAAYRMSGATADSHSFANGLALANNATLTGNGTLNGALTVGSGGTLAPGSSVGKIVLNTPPVLQGSVVMELSKSGSTLTNDQVQVSGTLTYGGMLTVTNLGPDALGLGDTFQLFPAGGYGGSFSALTLPSLLPGLGWTNQLLLNGSIKIINLTAPVISSFTQSGTNLNLNVTGGSPGGAWDLLTATNVALPVASWTTNISGVFDWVGNVTITNGINLTEPQRYYRISSP